MNRLHRLAAIALLIAALGSGIYWQRQRSASQQRLQAWEAHQLQEAIPAAWDQSFSWDKADLPLAEFAQLVAAKSGLAVELDEPGIAAVRSKQVQPGKIPIHVPPGEYPLHVLLRMALTADGLCADLRGQKIVITAEASSTARTRLFAATYPIPQPLPEGLAEEDWRHFISGVVEGHVEAVPDALIVVENALGHRRVQAMIKAICRLVEPNDTPADEPLEIPEIDAASRNQLLAALARPATIDCREMRLDDFVRHLVDQYRVPLILNAAALQNAGVSLDTQITKKLSNVSLQSVLRLTLSELELMYVLRDSVVVITTPEQAESDMRTVAYPVNDLLDDAQGDSLDELSELILQLIAPHSWDTGSGPGPIRSIDDARLLIHQTGEVHEQIIDFLGLLREVLGSPPTFAVAPARKSDPARKIREALDRTLSLDVKNESLQDVVSRFRDELDIPIVMNSKKLGEAGVSPNAPVTLSLRPGRAGLYLDLILESLELVSITRDQVLLITTPEDAESQLITRLYDTRRLLSAPFDTDGLHKLITSVVKPSTWDAVGGVGTQFFFRDILIVSHTEDVHREMEQLLGALDKNFTADAPQGDDRPWVIPVTAPPEQQTLEKRLEQLVDVQIDNQPLETALEQLARRHEINLILDRARIERDGHPLPLPPVSLAASQITLAAAFDRLLTPQALHYAVRENVVHVSSGRSVAEQDEIRLYRVGDLVPSRWRTVAKLQQALADAAAPTPFESAWIDDHTAAIEPDWLLINGQRSMHIWAIRWLSTTREANQP